MTVRKVIIFGILMLFQAWAWGQGREGDLRVESSARINELVAQKTEYSKEKNSYPGYKIQIYYGSEKECYEIRDEFRTLFQEITTSIVFSTPQWKLQVGEYRTRLEADQSIVGIKKEYPAAIVLATNISLD